MSRRLDRNGVATRWRGSPVPTRLGMSTRRPFPTAKELP